MSFMPGWGHSPPPVPAVVAPVPKAYVFNGTDEYLVRTLATSSPGTLRFTYSEWVKPLSMPAFITLWIVVGGTNFILGNITDSGDGVTLDQDSSGNIFGELGGGLTPDIAANAWVHLLWQIDTAQATAANRVRLYRNGTLLGATDGLDPTLNMPHALFTSGRKHYIGADPEEAPPDFSNCKMAFIDVVDGLALDPTSFAFNNSGTWTRKKYSGSYGTYGFNLDGTDGFNDVSGNGQHFTGTNMDATNVTNADMPPFTN
jgi:Concanavalin A-like lectin/glucanases superfamily